MPNIIETGGGNSNKLNIFCQTTEPVIKDGIWIQSSDTFKDIICKSKFVINGKWNDISTYPASSLVTNNYSVYGAKMLDTNTLQFLALLTNWNSGATSYTNSIYEYKFNLLTKTYSMISTVRDGGNPSTSSGSYNYASSTPIFRLTTKDFVFTTTQSFTYLNSKNRDATSWDGGSPYVYCFNGTTNTGINYTSISNVTLDDKYQKLRFLTYCNYSYYTSYIQYYEVPYSATSVNLSSNTTYIKQGTTSGAMIPIDASHVLILPCGDKNIVKYDTVAKTTTQVGTLPTDVLTFTIKSPSVATYNNKYVMPISVTAPTSSNNYLAIYDATYDTWSYVLLPINSSNYQYILHQSELYCFYKYNAVDYSVALNLTTNTLRNITDYDVSMSAFAENGNQNLFAFWHNNDTPYSHWQLMSYQLEQENLNENDLAILNNPKYTTCILNKDIILKSNNKYSTNVIDFGSNININYSFADAWLYKNGIYNEYPTYYGNGTAWVKFKN